MQKLFNCYFLLLLLASCKSNDTSREEEITARTPVTVTAISNEPLQEYVDLNATSSFLQK